MYITYKPFQNFCVFVFKGVTYRPYNEPDFFNMRPYLEANFPNDYPYSQYVNHEGELVYTPWRESEDPRGYCRSQYADENEVLDTKKCELNSIQPLHLPRQYSSEDSSEDSDEDGDTQLLKEPPEKLVSGLALRNSDSDCDDKDDLRVANSESDLTAGLKNEKPMQEICTEKNDEKKGCVTGLLLGIASLDEKHGNIEIDDEYINKRWPTRVFYGKDGELKHP
jgi:hypothetical protein